MNLDMKLYQCHKVVRAKQMTLGEYNKYRGWDIPENENPDDEGYLVEYQNSNNKVHENHDHYISWSPRTEFDDGYTKLTPLGNFPNS